MSTQRYDVLSITEKPAKDGGKPKAYFAKVGVAFPLREGEGWTVYLDSFPVSGKMLIKPPLEKNRGHGDDFPG